MLRKPDTIIQLAGGRSSRSSRTDPVLSLAVGTNFVDRNLADFLELELHRMGQHSRLAAATMRGWGPHLEVSFLSNRHLSCDNLEEEDDVVQQRQVVMMKPKLA